MKNISFLTSFILFLASTAAAYDFSSTTTTGQTLYYTLTGETTVRVESPTGSGWEGFSTPTGKLVIPSTIEHEGASYSVVEVYRMAFSQCYELTEVEVPGTVKSIGLRAFAADTALARVVLGEGVERVDMMAFYECTHLNAIQLPSTLNRIAISAFDGTAYYNNPTNWNLTYTLLLGPWMLKEGNLYMGSVHIPEGIIGLANSAFLGCDGVSSIELPSSLRYVGEGTFRGCTTLDTLRLLGHTPPEVADDAFSGLIGITVVVPCGSMDAYSTEPIWGQLNLIEASCDTTPYVPYDTTTIPDPHPTLSIAPTPTTSSPLINMLGDGISIDGLAGESFIVVDLYGRTVYACRQAVAHQYVPLHTRGIYLLGWKGAWKKIAYCR